MISATGVAISISARIIIIGINGEFFTGTGLTSFSRCAFQTVFANHVIPIFKTPIISRIIP